jgi:4-alpha-glucanotransferase
MLPRCAGILIPLFSLRTNDDLGRGEILDLAPMIDLALAMGHRVIQLLPLDECAPDETSPYSAMSVFAIDPMYISARGLRGVGKVSTAHAHERVGGARSVPRTVIRPIKLALLRRAYRAWVRANPATGAGTREFDRFAGTNRAWLADYALFRALKERFSWAPWEEWPPEIARREPAALAAARSQLADPVRMYTYWQFLAHRQWNEMRVYAAERGARFGGDMAFSPARDSAEVWANQDVFDLERTVGAPPDGFNPKGQRWGLPLPRWDTMRAGGLGLWRARARHAAALYDLVRIDHVVGLYRTFAFPCGDDDAPGALVPDHEPQQREQGEAIMRELIDAARPTEIIAEDLGTVPPWVRESLTAMGVPGYKVMQWERHDWGQPNERFKSPSEYPELSLATTGTHDTETLTVWWSEQPEEERARLLRALGLNDRISTRRALDEAALDAVLEALYAAPSRLVLVPIQDLFGWRTRINRPGTVNDFNWTYRLPLAIDRLVANGWVRARIGRIRAIAERTARFA